LGVSVQIYPERGRDLNQLVRRAEGASEEACLAPFVAGGDKKERLIEIVSRFAP
jgi:hypothetical protein